MSNARAVPGEPQLAAVDARIVMRAPEPGGAPRPALQIERVIGLSAQTQCGAPPAARATLETTYWKLVRCTASRWRRPSASARPI